MIVHVLVTYLSEGCWCEEVSGLVGRVDEFFCAASTDTVLGLHRMLLASNNTIKYGHGHNKQIQQRDSGPYHKFHSTSDLC